MLKCLSTVFSTFLHYSSTSAQSLASINSSSKSRIHQDQLPQDISTRQVAHPTSESRQSWQRHTTPLTTHDPSRWWSLHPYWAEEPTEHPISSSLRAEVRADLKQHFRELRNNEHYSEMGFYWANRTPVPHFDHRPPDSRVEPLSVKRFCNKATTFYWLFYGRLIPTRLRLYRQRMVTRARR